MVTRRQDAEVMPSLPRSFPPLLILGGTSIVSHIVLNERRQLLTPGHHLNPPPTPGCVAKAHVRFGGRSEETGWPKDQYRASLRSNYTVRARRGSRSISAG